MTPDLSALFSLGLRGLTGAKGDLGVIGHNGASGKDGIPGSAGPQGTKHRDTLLKKKLFQLPTRYPSS